MSRVSWLLPTEQRALRCCAHKAASDCDGSCMDTRLSGLPKMNESCSGLRSSHASALNRSLHDMTITEKQNHPGWLMIIDLILLTADGKAAKSKESFCSRELQPFVRSWVTEHHSEETQ